MARQPRLQTGVVLSVVFALTTVLLALGQRGGGGGGGTPTGGGGQRSSSPTSNTSSRGTAQPPRGMNSPAARGDGSRRGQQEKKKDDDLSPTDGMVMAYITVTDKQHRSIAGLKKENFKITEDNAEQAIESFSMQNGPLSVGFVLGGPPSETRGIPLAFLKATPWPANEFFLVNDTHSPPGGTVIQSFTTDLMKATTIYSQGGVTADSIYMGLDYLKEAANTRKILLTIGGTLSGDDVPEGSGMDPVRVERQATKQDVQVYSILTSNDGGDTYDDGETSAIAPLTGGRNYTAPPYAGTLESIAEDIAHGLAVQYEVGYRPTNQAKDGKWRKIRVSLVDPPENSGKLTIFTKAGYYADKEKKGK